MTSSAKILTFSVVTPSCNQADFIEDTIKSVLWQKGNFYIDYIIMDGGSTDSSVNIIKKYEQMLKEGQWPIKCKGINYRWVSEKDDGQSDAIEKGFALAEGDIGVWLNSDDTFYSDTVFETVAGYFENGDDDLIVGNGITIDKNGKKIGNYRTDRINIKELIFLDYHILQPSAFLKLSFFRNNPFDKSLYYSFDVDFFIRLLLSGIRYKKVPEILSCNRIYPGTKSTSGMGKLVREFIKIERKVSNNWLLIFLSWIYKYLSVAAHYKYKKSKIFWKIYMKIRNLFFFLILGTWGRK